MRGFVKFFALAACGYLGMVGPSQAVPIAANGSCGNPSLGTRIATVLPANPGGLCYAQLGNLQVADYGSIGLPSGYQFIDKNSEGGEIAYTGSGGTSGTWSLANGSALWGAFNKLYVGFHFGGGGECGKGNNPAPPCNLDPDSFVLELLAGATSGTWALGGGRLNGLSNIYLFGACTEPNGCRPPNDVPEPATLGLLGLGLAGFAFASVRRRKS